MALESGAVGHPVRDDQHRRSSSRPAGCIPKLRPRPGVRFGKPLDFSRYEGMAGDRFVERSMTDEIMYELMQLSGQEYVDTYAAKVKAARRRRRRLRRSRERSARRTRCANSATGCRTTRPSDRAARDRAVLLRLRVHRGRPRRSTLVSIGVVDETGREFYAVSTEFDPTRAIDWVRRNVLDKLPSPADPAWRSRAAIRDDLLALPDRARRADRAVGLDGRPTTTWRWPSCGATCGRCRARSRASPTSCGSAGRTPAAPPLPPRPADQHDALADARHNLARWHVI